jgi:hypothetical protein
MKYARNEIITLNMDGNQVMTCPLDVICLKLEMQTFCQTQYYIMKTKANQEFVFARN